MNSLIQLRGKLTPRRNPSKGGGSKLSTNTIVEKQKLEDINNELRVLHEYWKDKELIKGVLVNVEYNRIVPKSKRIKTILFKSSNDDVINCIKGAKYGISDGRKIHIITYYIPLGNLEYNINKIR